MCSPGTYLPCVTAPTAATNSCWYFWTLLLLPAASIPLQHVTSCVPEAGPCSMAPGPNSLFPCLTKRILRAGSSLSTGWSQPGLAFPCYCPSGDNDQEQISSPQHPARVCSIMGCAGTPWASYANRVTSAPGLLPCPSTPLICFPCFILKNSFSLHATCY